MSIFRNAIQWVIWLFAKRPVKYQLRSFKAVGSSPNSPDSYRTMSEYIDGDW